jgi:hypothetical protein
MVFEIYEIYTMEGITTPLKVYYISRSTIRKNKSTSIFASHLEEARMTRIIYLTLSLLGSFLVLTVPTRMTWYKVGQDWGGVKWIWRHVHTAQFRWPFKGRR